MSSMAEILGNDREPMASAQTDDPPSTAENPPAAQSGAEAEDVAANDRAAPTATPAVDDQGNVVDLDEAADAHPVPRKALIEERKKRQQEAAARLEAERLLAEARGQLQAYSQFASTGANGTQPAAQKPKTDPTEEFYGNPVAFIEGRERAMQERFQAQHLRMSAAMMRAQNPDYDEVLPAFYEAVKEAPYLEKQALEHPHPALFAYQIGKNRMELKKYGGSIDEAKKKIREEVQAEFEAKAKQQATANAAAQANKSTAGARGTGARAAAPASKELTLKGILGK